MTFDRVVLINLKRRPDRLAAMEARLAAVNWPFAAPELFEAIDGHAAPVPAFFQAGPGAWGCLQSHRKVLGQAIRDSVQSLLILEDDILFAEDFGARAAAFLDAIPADWDQIYFGGHFNNLRPNEPVAPGIVRTFGCELSHAIALRGDFLRLIYDRFHSGGKFDGSAHNDWILARDPELQPDPRWHIYAAVPWLITQGGDRRSDISTPTPRRPRHRARGGI